MSVNDLADLLIAARGRVDFYWNFYAVMVIAIIGWLMSPKRHLTVPMKVAVTVVYIVAGAMNLLGLLSSYALAEALRTDLLRAAVGTPLEDTRTLLAHHSYPLHRAAAFSIHVVIGAAILFAIWSARPSDGETAAPVPTGRPEQAPPPAKAPPQET